MNTARYAAWNGNLLKSSLCLAVAKFIAAQLSIFNILMLYRNASIFATCILKVLHCPNCEEGCMQSIHFRINLKTELNQIQKVTCQGTRI